MSSLFACSESGFPLELALRSASNTVISVCSGSGVIFFSVIFFVGGGGSDLPIWSPIESRLSVSADPSGFSVSAGKVTVAWSPCSDGRRESSLVDIASCSPGSKMAVPRIEFTVVINTELNRSQGGRSLQPCNQWFEFMHAVCLGGSKSGPLTRLADDLGALVEQTRADIGAGSKAAFTASDDGVFYWTVQPRMAS